MRRPFVIVSDADMDRLSRLVRALKHSLFRDQQQLELLDQTLESAEVRLPDRVPRDIIRMNSRARVFDFDTRQKEVYTLVFPDEANFSSRAISVLAPLGIALLGRKQGDIIEARVPGGIRRLRVDRVLQRSRVASESVRENQRAGSKGHLGTRVRQAHLAA